MLMSWPLCGLGGRREDRLGQPIRFAQARRQRDAADARRSLRSPSSPSPTGSRAPRTRSAAARCVVTSIERPRSSPRPRARSAGIGRRVGREQVIGDDRAACARTRTPRSASAPCPCRGCRSRARSRTRRCDRWRRSAADRRTRRCRGLCPGDPGARSASVVWRMGAASGNRDPLCGEGSHLTGDASRADNNNM